MNKRQKEVQQVFLNSEKAVLKQLEKNYREALNDINSKLAALQSREDADMQYVIYQVEYQKALKAQVEGILDQLHANEFETVSDYLTKSYENGFIGSMYDMQGQGVPLLFPIDQAQVVKAIQHDTKLSEDLYSALGKDIKKLSKQIASEISRGLSSGAMYSDIARNIREYAQIPQNNAMRIARTEAHRIQCQAAADAQFKAKEKGADVVKQWDAALDGSTRPTHRQLDGQIRELEEPFEVAGMKAMQPGGFGRPEEDINCRCALLQRARWALGGEYTKYSPDAPILFDDDGTTQFVDMSDAKNYEEFKEHYLQAIEHEQYSEWEEAERITKSADYAVDYRVIDSREYVDKFYKIADDQELSREYYKAAKEILHHRSGQNGEDLYLYNTKTGKWYKSTSGTNAGTPEYTQEILDGIAKANAGELISFHNHPAGMPPSADDINAAKRNGYAKGYALCHDGKIYEYTPSELYIDQSIYDLRIADFQEKGYSEFEAQLETMKYLSDLYGFSFMEV